MREMTIIECYKSVWSKYKKAPLFLLLSWTLMPPLYVWEKLNKNSLVKFNDWVLLKIERMNRRK